MNLKKAVLVCAGSAPKEATRTVIQKLLYFATLKGLTKAPYDAHYYGPYSYEVASTLEDLSSTGLVKELVEAHEAFDQPWEIRTYRYMLPKSVEKALDRVLTAEDKKQAERLERIIDICRKQGSLNPKALSVAAKVLYILNETGRSLTDSEIVKEATKLGWKVPQAEITKSVAGLLADLELVEREP